MKNAGMLSIPTEWMLKPTLLRVECAHKAYRLVQLPQYYNRIFFYSGLRFLTLVNMNRVFIFILTRQ